MRQPVRRKKGRKDQYGEEAEKEATAGTSSIADNGKEWRVRGTREWGGSGVRRDAYLFVVVAVLGLLQRNLHLVECCSTLVSLPLPNALYDSSLNKYI
jgi:hypothetical protein